MRSTRSAAGSPVIGQGGSASVLSAMREAAQHAHRSAARAPRTRHGASAAGAGAASSSPAPRGGRPRAGAGRRPTSAPRCPPARPGRRCGRLAGRAAPRAARRSRTSRAAWRPRQGPAAKEAPRASRGRRGAPWPSGSTRSPAGRCAPPGPGGAGRPIARAPPSSAGVGTTSAPRARKRRPWRFAASPMVRSSTSARSSRRGRSSTASARRDRPTEPPHTRPKRGGSTSTAAMRSIKATAWPTRPRPGRSCQRKPVTTWYSPHIAGDARAESRQGCGRMSASSSTTASSSASTAAKPARRLVFFCPRQGTCPATRSSTGKGQDGASSRTRACAGSASLSTTATKRRGWRVCAARARNSAARPGAVRPRGGSA